MTVSQRQATRRLDQDQKQRGKMRWLLSFALGVLLISLTLWGVSQLMNPALLPIHSVKIDGELSHINHKNFQKIVTSYTSKGFLMLDMAGLKEQLEKLPWVNTVSVWRVWPDTLRINVIEQIPVARWSDNSLLNSEGEIFDPVNDIPTGLPHLEGPLGEQNLVFQNFRDMSALLKPLNLQIQWLGLAARHAWRLQLSNGMVVILGRDDALTRLSQFITAYPHLFNVSNRVADYVDLRYEHGMAIHWKTV